MKIPKKPITHREILTFLEQMRGLHARALNIKSRCVPFGEMHEQLEDLLRRMDNTAELITNDRKFLYTSPHVQELKNLYEHAPVF